MKLLISLNAPSYVKGNRVAFKFGRGQYLVGTISKTLADKLYILYDNGSKSAALPKENSYITRLPDTTPILKNPIGADKYQKLTGKITAPTKAKPKLTDTAAFIAFTKQVNKQVKADIEQKLAKLKVKTVVSIKDMDKPKSKVDKGTSTIVYSPGTIDLPEIVGDGGVLSFKTKVNGIPTTVFLMWRGLKGNTLNHTIAYQVGIDAFK